MAEVLGAVTAAAQLATYAIALGNVFLSLKSSKSTIAEHRQSLDDLRLIANYITRTPLLQTSEIERLTNSIITAVHASPVHEALFNGSKNPVIRAITVTVYEKQIQDLFRSIEQKKSTLSLFIAQIQTLQLSEIQSTIQDMPPWKPTLCQARRSEKHSHQQHRDSALNTVNGALSLYRGQKLQEYEIASGSRDTHQSRDTADFVGNKHRGFGLMHLGPWLKKRAGVPVVTFTRNVRYKGSTRERPKGKNKEHLTCDMICGPIFTKEAIPEEYAGRWEDNIQKADARMILGAVIE